MYVIHWLILCTSANLENVDPRFLSCSCSVTKFLSVNRKAGNVVVDRTVAYPLRSLVEFSSIALLESLRYVLLSLVTRYACETRGTSRCGESSPLARGDGTRKTRHDDRTHVRQSVIFPCTTMSKSQHCILFNCGLTS